MIRRKVLICAAAAILPMFVGINANAVDVAQMSNCEFARNLRRAIALGPQESAILGITSQAHATIVSDVETFCTQNRETLQPLLSAVEVNQGDAMHSYELAAEDIATKDGAYATASEALTQACSNLITTINTRLTTDQRTQWQNQRSHSLFDSAIAGLTLSSEQVSAIQAAQRTRDQVLRHQSNRKNPTASAEATQSFETALAAILDEGQEASLATARGALANNIAAIAAYEESHCNN